MVKVLLGLAAFSFLLMTVENHAQTPKDFAAIWEQNHVSDIAPSNARHRDLQKYLEGLKAIGLTVEEVGRSYGNREIYQAQWGRGPLRVFMWSQMHGDEPTATSALIDMLTYLRKNGDRKWVKKMEETLTIRAVPMLNPDGAEFYQRRNLQGIDINRDATSLKTPEGQLLKKLRDEWKPQVGFNLHNQNSLTTAGDVPKQAAMSLLAVLGNPDGITNPGYERNKRICVAVAGALAEFIPGHIGRYDESYNALAFGDNFSAWGTPVILIETGALHGKDEMFLVKMNFVAFLTALQILSEGTDKNYDAALYSRIPLNDSGRLMNFIFRNATLVNRQENIAPFTADIGVNFERRRADFVAPTYIRDIGGLTGNTGLVEYDVSDFYVVSRFGRLRPGENGEFMFFRKSRQIDWKMPNLETDGNPDAIFSLGNWHKGGELMAGKLIGGAAPKTDSSR